MKKTKNLPADTKNLVQKAGQPTWYVRLAVPKDVQKQVGCKVFKKSLQTASLTEAQRRRGAYISAWWEQIEAVRNSKNPPENLLPYTADTLIAVNTLLQNQKRKLIGENVPALPDIDPEFLERFLSRPKVLEALFHMRMQAGKGIAGKIALIDDFADSMKRVTQKKLESMYTLSEHQKSDLAAVVASPENFIPKSPITASRIEAFNLFRETRGGEPKHVSQQVGKMKRLSSFLNERKLPLDFDAIDQWLQSLDRAPNTLAQYLMAGTAFWKWAMQYDAQWKEAFKEKANPFESHVIPKGGGSKTAEMDRKAYTPGQLEILHSAAVAAGKSGLADLILLGAYTGARIEELCQLKSTDVVMLDNIKSFEIRASKTKAGIRSIPVHTEILSTVERLILDSKDGYLIPSPSVNLYGKRSAALSKSFGLLRKNLNFGPLYVFHGIRHTVITALVRADVSDALIKELVGHETGTITHDVYSKGASTSQKFKAICKLRYDFKKIS